MGWISYFRSEIELIVGHWGHQKTQMYYNGLHHDQITAEDGPIEMGIERINPSPIISYCRMDQIRRHCRTRSSSRLRRLRPKTRNKI